MPQKQAEDNDIVIGEWQAGIADSPHVGFADMRNVLVDEIPGVLTIGFKATKQSGTTVTGFPKWFKRDSSTSNIYCLDNDGKVYKSTDAGVTWALVSGNTLPSATQGGQGLVIWKGYLFVARDTSLDVMSISAETWTNAWQTIDTGGAGESFHPMIIASDDKIYGGAGRYVFRVVETSGTTFDPANSATYTFTARALDIPAQYRVKCLEQLGRYLLPGTFVGAALPDNKIGDLFPWDRNSSSFLMPMKVNENGVSQLLTVGNTTYLVCGMRGTVYVTNGSQVQRLRQLKFIDFSSGKNLNSRPGAITLHNGKVFFGTANGGGVTQHGVYSIRPDGAVVLENTISFGSTSDGNIGALLSINDEAYLIGWQSTTAQGIDLVAKDSRRTTSYGAYVDTVLFRVGSAKRLRSFSEIEFNLSRDLATGQGVRVKWRQSLNDAFTTLATFDFATHGALSSVRLDAPIADVENVQFRVELTTDTDMVTTPELREIRIR